MVADDGSTGDAHEYLKEMEPIGWLIAVINKGQFKGACFARNCAIWLVKRELITALFDSDIVQSKHDKYSYNESA